MLCHAAARHRDEYDLHRRSIATTRFRCRRCGTPGVPKFRPAELLQVGGPVTLAFLWGNSCLWEIDQAQLDKPPWSGSAQHYRCPGCGGRVDWHITWAGVAAGRSGGPNFTGSPVLTIRQRI
jgi:DNA-directed RNA polymerase subunit RPC12/RpoP